MATLEQAKQLCQTLTDKDLQSLKTWIILDETSRRAALPQIEQAEARLITELQDAGKLDKPDTVTAEEAQAAPDKVPAWENPLTDHARMYHAGAVVTHNERVWQSTHPGLNHWEPGATGVDERIWLDITHQVQPTEPEEPTAGVVIPFGPGLPVKQGDVVEFEGERYKVISDHTTAEHWPPNEAEALFQKL